MTKETQRQTAEWFADLKPSVKDMVCTIYGYILKHENNPKVMADFTDVGIGWACNATSITTVSPKFIQRVIDNIDHIKNLYENRPSKRVVYWTEYEERLDIGPESTARCYFKHITLYGYDEFKLNGRIEHERTDWSGRYTHKFENKLELSA